MVFVMALLIGGHDAKWTWNNLTRRSSPRLCHDHGRHSRSLESQQTFSRLVLRCEIEPISVGSAMPTVDICGTCSLDVVGCIAADAERVEVAYDWPSDILGVLLQYQVCPHAVLEWIGEGHEESRDHSTRSIVPCIVQIPLVASMTLSFRFGGGTSFGLGRATMHVSCARTWVSTVATTTLRAAMSRPNRALMTPTSLSTAWPTMMTGRRLPKLSYYRNKRCSMIAASSMVAKDVVPNWNLSRCPSQRSWLTRCAFSLMRTCCVCMDCNTDHGVLQLCKV